MALLSAETDYHIYENRLASFRGPQPVAKRRTSTASSRAPKALNWPHKTLSPSSFAKAGFFFHPSPGSPDNVVCFLCDKHLDGWEEDDDPLVEHLKHVPDCGWAIVAAVEAELNDYAKIHPLDPRMIDARKATFAGRWPYDAKKGWKCKTKQLVEGGWYYSPNDESDDMATCAYCQLKLDGWEAGDKPIDEHRKRSPDCDFFIIIDQAAAPKRPRATKARASKASRYSTQSVATTMSDLQSLAGDMTLDPDVSVMTTTSVATQGGKKGRPRKTATNKTRKTRAKKEEAVEIPEDSQGAEVPPSPPPKPAKGRKRASEEIEESIVMNVGAPPPKKRATRGRTSQAVADGIGAPAEVQELDMTDAPAPPAKQPAGRKKGRASAAKTSTRKASGTSLKSKASTASLRAQAAQADSMVDDALERQLQEDLDRPLTEDEYMTADSDSERNKPVAPSKQTAPAHKSAARGQQQQTEDYAMFDPAPVEDDDAQVEEELRALEAEMTLEHEPKQLVVPKKGKKAGTRKVSKQTKKTKEPEPSQPTAQEPVDEPAEDSVVVSQLPVIMPGPEPVAEDPDSSSATIVNKTSSSSATAAKRGRGRPKKNSGASEVSVDHQEPEAVAPAAPLAQTTRNTNKSLPPAPPSPPPQSEKPVPATPRAHHIAPSAQAKQATLSPSQTPQSSDAENQPPSSKPASAATSKHVVLPPPTTPGRTNASSPSRRNVVGGLKSAQPWGPVDLDLVFGLVGDAAEAENLLRRRGAELTTPERDMTVEQWIFHNATLAEKMLKAECEGMVTKFEAEGGRAMRALEGLVVE